MEGVENGVKANGWCSILFAARRRHMFDLRHAPAAWGVRRQAGCGGKKKKKRRKGSDGLGRGGEGSCMG